MPDDDTLQSLKQALEAHRKALEELEKALLAQLESRNRNGHDNGHELLSIPEVCKKLGMGKSWVYKRVQSREIPSIQLGHTVKVRRDDLEEFLQKHYRGSRNAE